MNELQGGEHKVAVQVGADMNDYSTYDMALQVFLPDIDLDITTVEKAQASLSKLDEIIDSVHKSRSNMGFQHTLLDEQMKMNLTRIENISNSQSLVRDADTAVAYNDLITQSSIIEQTQLLQSQLTTNHYNLLSKLISGVAS